MLFHVKYLEETKRYILNLQVISIGFIKAGEAFNVIPETVMFGGTYRSVTTEGLIDLSTRIKDVSVHSILMNHSTSAALTLGQQIIISFLLAIFVHFTGYRNTSYCAPLYCHSRLHGSGT